MIGILKKHGRLNETVFLGLSSIICFAFTIYRYILTGSTNYLFLNWNLFLAFIPWLLSSLMIIYPQWQNKKRFIGSLMAVWLLFFPNAPYIFTDLFHLGGGTLMPPWFDLILLLSFAWTGMLFGFLSLMDIEKILNERMRYRWVTLVSFVLLIMSSFGIYVGRYLRWNSWDIINEPISIFSDVFDRFAAPMEHPRTWGMTLFMGLFLNIIYWSFRLIRSRKHSKESAVLQHV